MHTLADITQITGAKRRTVQLWAEAGAIKAEPLTERAGSGVHRVFSDEEVFVACVLNGLASKSISIGVLIRAAEAFRSLIATPSFKEIIFNAIDGKRTNRLIYEDDDKCIFWSSRDREPLESKLMGYSYVVINLNACLRPLLLRVFNSKV